MESDASLDEQIEKAQERLQKAKAQHDSAAADLRKLLEGRDSRRQKLLMAAIAKSDKSFEDILSSSDHLLHLQAPYYPRQNQQHRNHLAGHPACFSFSHYPINRAE
jgi:hypothetical protein